VINWAIRIIHGDLLFYGQLISNIYSICKLNSGLLHHGSYSQVPEIGCGHLWRGGRGH
jgi:hypothetical protein